MNLDPFGNEVVSFGVGAPVGLSADGQLVGFTSMADNLVAADTNGAEDVFVHDRQTGVTTLVSVDSFGNQVPFSIGYFALASEGRFVAFQSGGSLVDGDTNNSSDVFVHDRQTSSPRA